MSSIYSFIKNNKYFLKTPGSLKQVLCKQLFWLYFHMQVDAHLVGW